jgi:hypothetical protein
VAGSPGASGNELEEVDRLLRAAITDRRLVEFTLDGLRRVGEPHDYGMIGGVAKLFFYQVGGQSRSPSPVGWRWAELTKIVELRILHDRDRFAGTRPTASARHIHWDILFATVSPRAVSDRG